MCKQQRGDLQTILRPLFLNTEVVGLCLIIANLSVTTRSTTRFEFRLESERPVFYCCNTVSQKKVTLWKLSHCS